MRDLEKSSAPIQVLVDWREDAEYEAVAKVYPQSWEDALHEHLQSSSFSDWAEISSEAIGILNDAFGCDIEKLSPMATVISAACIASYRASSERLLQMLGLNTNFIFKTSLIAHDEFDFADLDNRTLKNILKKIEEYINACQQKSESITAIEHHPV